MYPPTTPSLDVYVDEKLESTLAFETTRYNGYINCFVTDSTSGEELDVERTGSALWFSNKNKLTMVRYFKSLPSPMSMKSTTLIYIPTLSQARENLSPLAASMILLVRRSIHQQQQQHIQLEKHTQHQLHLLAPPQHTNHLISHQ
jgi:hypothetical protein